jgi:hypothetical protein
VLRVTAEACPMNRAVVPVILTLAAIPEIMQRENAWWIGRGSLLDGKAAVE